jgi:hypothetical protein
MVGKLTPDNQLSVSRLPALLNASPWETQNELLEQFISIDEGNPPKQIPQNEPMELGDFFEPMILRKAAERLGLTNVETDITVPYQHDFLPLAASLDGTGVGKGSVIANWDKGIYVPQGGAIDIEGVGLIEAKLTSARPEEIPATHRGRYQLQGQMMCTGYKWGCIAVLYQSTTLRLFVYRADETIQNRIREAVIDFENRRKNMDKYPVVSPADGVAAYGRVDADAPPLELEGDDALWVDHLMAAKANKAMAEREIE